MAYEVIGFEGTTAPVGGVSWGAAAVHMPSGLVRNAVTGSEMSRAEFGDYIERGYVALIDAITVDGSLGTDKPVVLFINTECLHDRAWMFDPRPIGPSIIGHRYERNTMTFVFKSKRHLLEYGHRIADRVTDCLTCKAKMRGYASGVAGEIERQDALMSAAITVTAKNHPRIMALWASRMGGVDNERVLIVFRGLFSGEELRAFDQTSDAIRRGGV